MHIRLSLVMLFEGLPLEQQVLHERHLQPQVWQALRRLLDNEEVLLTDLDDWTCFLHTNDRKI